MLTVRVELAERGRGLRGISFRKEYAQLLVAHVCFLASVNAGCREILCASRSTAGTNAATLHPIRLVMANQIKRRDQEGRPLDSFLLVRGVFIVAHPPYDSRALLRLLRKR